MVAQFPETASIAAPESLESVWVPMVKKRAYSRASDTPNHPIQTRNSPFLAIKAVSSIFSGLPYAKLLNNLQVF